MQLADFDFTLPEGLIAQEPTFPRDACRLLVADVKSHSLKDHIFRDLREMLGPNDVLVLNRSKVIPARINFEHEGRALEIFLLEKEPRGWRCMVKPGKRFALNSSFTLAENVFARVDDVLEDGTRLIRFSDESGGALADETVFTMGEMPLPPYITDSKAAFTDYQTVFAKEAGSVAAPTAGLHFTDELLADLRASGVQIEEVLLHVNRGTFLPVKTDNILDHKMHSEIYSLDEETASRLNEAVNKDKRIIAVGTTVVRVLESTYLDNSFKSGTGSTNIFIYPGYKWRCVGGLITNFHLPKSTLLMLVASFMGKDFAFEAYTHAINRKYRFYSFGDAMFIS